MRALDAYRVRNGMRLTYELLRYDLAAFHAAIAKRNVDTVCGEANRRVDQQRFERDAGVSFIEAA